jgi:hypothetical protein
VGLRLEQLAPSFARIDVGTVSFWFSFEVCVAFAAPEGMVIAEGDWHRATRKHLRMIDDEDNRRVDYSAFLALLAKGDWSNAVDISTRGDKIKRVDYAVFLSLLAATLSRQFAAANAGLHGTGASADAERRS